MADEKPNKYEALPIPSYEEAIGSSSRSSTPYNNEASEPAEREGLLANDPGDRLPLPTRRAGYRPPPTDGTPSVSDVGEHEHDSFLNQHDGQRDSNATEDEEVRREMEELEIVDPPTHSTWGKRLSQSLSSINLPFNWKFPNFNIQWKWPRFDANMCIVLTRCFAVVLVLAIVYLLFMSDIFTNAAQRMSAQMFDPESVRMHVQSVVNVGRIEEHLRKIAQNDHLAGTEGDYMLAKYVQDFFLSSGLEDVHMEEFRVYLNYPKQGGRKVEILKKDGSVQWSAKIDEDPMYTDPPRQETPAFHGHSRSGDVTGPLIYANYGLKEDFKRLYDTGIDTKGAIALVRASGQREGALKVRAAELAGFAGCIIYNDPADNGFVKGDVAPNGRYMPEGGVQRDSVSLANWVVGDPLTPGWASTDGAKASSKDNNKALVNIPSIPLSWGDAQHLLQAIKGIGEACPDEWKGGIPKTEYWSGDHSSPMVRLLNDQDEVEKQRIWNVIGRIQGIEQGEKSVIIGNHRDAWVYGAAGPGSGTAVMLEVASIFSDLVQRGWRPLRTIEFASWDAGEFNLMGSTEHVEANIDRLREHAFVYMNVGTGVGGHEFKARGNPIFRKALLRVLDRTTDPLQNTTLRDLWDQRGGQLDSLAVDSDYVAFQDMAGTSSLDFGFDGPNTYQSAYDTFEQAASGDPGFQYHGLLTQIWSLLILEFSDRLVLPFDISAYAAAASQWALDLANWVGSQGANQEGNTPWIMEPLREAVLQFTDDAKKFEKWELDWDNMVLGGGGFESAMLSARRQDHNIRMANLESHLLDLDEGGGVSYTCSPFELNAI
jgi:hypothetical protein